MKKMSTKALVSEILQTAGIALNGSNPWDMQVYDDRLYGRLLESGSLSLGESYLDAWWNCTALDDFFFRLMHANIENKIKKNKRLLFHILIGKLINLQTKQRAFEVGEKHYDLGNDLFTQMLDSSMTYTCGYWKNANTLEEAQLAKLELVCQKLMLRPGMRVLDIGCGWGAWAKYAATKYGVEVVGVTISVEQAKYAQQSCQGLPVDIRVQDYRDVNESFDRIVSLGMFEHVGHLNYETYMQLVHHCLKGDDGLFLLHTIGSNQTVYRSDEWISKYIFPNGMLPSIAQIGKTTEKLFIMEDWHNFGVDYDKTLMAWQENFTKNWDNLKSQYDERFYRMWNYYLLSCAGGFRAREMQLWQIVFSKKGLPGGYQAPR